MGLFYIYYPLSNKKVIEHFFSFIEYNSLYYDPKTHIIWITNVNWMKLAHLLSISL